MSYDTNIRPLNQPPTTKELQRHFGLTRREAVKFHQDHDQSYARFEGTTSDWHSYTFKLVSELKSKRASKLKHKLGKSDVAFIHDISLREGHLLESAGTDREGTVEL